MRKLTLAVLAAGAALVAPALAADLPFYPPIVEVPDVDYGYTGSFYLRGSAGLNLMWAPNVYHPTATPTTYNIDGFGYGYSYGVGAGFETGTGLRFDVTADILRNEGMRATVDDGAAGPLVDGVHKLALRSSVFLANAYYDVGFGDGYGAAGGAFGYVGGGLGVAFNDHTVTDPLGATVQAQNTSLAAAGMVGLGYDFGQIVADVGYRGLYINRIENTTAAYPYSVDNNWVHEVRGTVRYRFN
ncbi:outer membrane protein [Devosia chinhatensis]|uniref:Outer membrane protein beta-barrel domain-containing protein n=1 Tax=Devosia chinhatensis TaxID=429727 RepID=A0A0F5FFU1_9HYPH|nr:hypothetical protein [Devosia chinhatensis]KKB07465.1 hypothetical protein VE26_11940 [Devosia chinhatensis]